MSTQMTVRLSDTATAHIDKLVAEETVDSRASYLTWLVEREVQRQEAWQEVLRLRREGVPLNNPELEGMHEKLARRSLAHLD